jgi:hypothetical protein
MKTTYQVTVEHETVLPHAERYFFTMQNALENALSANGVKVVGSKAQIMAAPVELMALPVIAMPPSEPVVEAL